MKIITANIIEAVSADVEDPNFSVQNVLKPHSKQRYKAGAYSATITASLGGGSNALTLYNIQADSLHVVITASDGSTVLLDETVDLVHDDGWGAYTAQAAFFSYAEDSSTHTATITLSAASNEVALGILFGGKALSFTDPCWGLGDNAKSHSIIYDLDNGYDYIFQRNISSVPNFKLQVFTEDEYFNFLRLANAAYPKPLAVKLDNVIPDFQHRSIWYARMAEVPKGTRTKWGNYYIEFALKEFL